jgi:hypothetical protein
LDKAETEKMKLHKQCAAAVQEKCVVEKQVELGVKEKSEAEGKIEKALKEKSEVEVRAKRFLKEKGKAEAKADKYLKEKDEVKQLAEKIQATVQSLYKEVPKVPLVVEATVEDQVSNISIIIKGLQNKIIELELRALPGTPPEEREQRERTTQTIVEKIKSLEQECIKMCDKGTCIWKNITNNPEM